MPAPGYWDTLREQIGQFTAQDAARRTGTAGDPVTAAIEDRKREGRLMAALLGPVAPLATVPVAAAGYGYEGLKGLGQATGLGQYLPGPFKVDATSSGASVENPTALLGGFTEQAGKNAVLQALLSKLRGTETTTSIQ